jgi:membrane-associated phospholipid phosphatase
MIGKYSIIHDVISKLYYIILVGILLESILFVDKRGLILFIGLLIIERMSIYLKLYIFKPLFLKFGDIRDGIHYLPLLGRGERPDSACDCGMFLTGTTKKNISWGFPSGHSLIAGFITGFGVTYVYINKLQQNKMLSLIAIMVFVLISVVSVYARVKIAQCHTWQQGIFGNMLGIIFGYLYYKLLKL